MFIVDIPDWTDWDTWVQVQTFSTKKEAIAFCKENFGADDNGKIALISEIEEDNDGDSERED